MTAVPLRIDGADRTPAIQWAEGLRFALPRAVLERTRWVDRIDANGELTLSAGDTLSADEVRAVREFAAFTETPPASARSPISYQRVPGWARAAIASAIGWRQRGRVGTWAAFPQWPLDLTTDLLADLAGLPRANLGARTPVLLTHDIDSAEGLANLVREFLPREEAAGARSTSYIVPCAWSVDAGALQAIRARGHEAGVHGYDHSHRTPFVDEADRARRLDAAAPFAERYDARGYRAPSLLRTRALLRDLAPRYDYDSSIPTSGGLFPVPNNGCASARPFSVEGMLEVPLTLPRDGSLRFLGHTPDEILRLWIDGAETIARSGGVVVVLTHCEARFSGAPAMLDVYDRFLDFVRAAPGRFVFSTMHAVANHIRMPR